MAQSSKYKIPRPALHHAQQLSVQHDEEMDCDKDADELSVAGLYAGARNQIYVSHAVASPVPLKVASSG